MLKHNSNCYIVSNVGTVVPSIWSSYWEVLFEWQLLLTFKIKVITYKLSNPRNNYCKGAHSQQKHKEKKKCEKAFSQRKRTPSQIFLKDFVHFKNICFNNTFASHQFKTKRVSYNTNSFQSSFSLLRYLYVFPLNFIAREQFMLQKAYATEGIIFNETLGFC